MACRDFAKGEKVAKEFGFPEGTYKVMHCDLSANNSVRMFVNNFRSMGVSLDCLVCNAAVYFPNAHKAGVGIPGLFPGGGPRWSADGHELSFAANYLGHFLLVNLLLEDLKKANDARCIILGTVTATVNGKELGGQIPPLANLGDLSGLEKGMQQPITMIDGGAFDGAKAYKDSKVCDVMMMRELHKRYHKETGINFSSLYPGCIAETNLFREHYPVFQKLFPAFHQNVTRAYVSQEEAGRRLASVVSDAEYNKSGSYYSWQGKSGTGGEGGAEAKSNTEETSDFFLNTGSFRTMSVDEIGGQAGNDENCKKLWDLSTKLAELA
jgi:protochlorophyllide reductase